MSYRVQCSVCERIETTGPNPLKNGWPKCHGYTMTLIDNEKFKADIDRAMGEIFAPVKAAREALGA